MKHMKLAALALGLGIALGACAAQAIPAGATPAATSPAPAYCGHPSTVTGTLVVRNYYLAATPDQVFLRSGAHGRGGLLRCITIYVGDKSGAQYAKTIVINESTGGLKIPVTGVDVTYVNCALPPLRYFYPNPGPNDCLESSGTTEDNWQFPGTSTPMIPDWTP